MKMVLPTTLLVSISLIMSAHFCHSADVEERPNNERAGTSESVSFLPPDPGAIPRDIVGAFLPGGRNVEAHRYVITEGYPPFPDRAKFVGVLSGTWSEMGRSLGERAGDKVRCTSDIWWGKSATRKERRRQ